ncbi:hypothetical protein KUCAC02_027562 [Chaenocephalus aceratus]|uniref:Uncharacterized protein n=1 Tax=Chaenocephalus aceratus TaxID=36190 RepID=A0ACB9W3X5_CHAAC|nr:hypothetical protein KUCAC02_027562 [Chaenocephalus aceratus]
MEDDMMFTMEEEGSAKRPPVQQRTPNQRTYSLSDANASDDDDGEYDKHFICPILEDTSVEICHYLKNLVYSKQLSNSPKTTFMFKARWKHAIEKAKAMPDPWAEFHLEEKVTEPCIRYRYNASTGEWAQDQVHIKMASQPFGKGAMRECFRTTWRRWTGTFTLRTSGCKWRPNCGRGVQRNRPPPQTGGHHADVCDEMVDRPGKPLFHLEHYIEGHYIKYNSNSGFVRDDNIRLTPSHFTFERSGHQLIVVDIQGVGDLYTDPQIHTEQGTDFGDGNLGVREKSQLDCTNKLLKSAKTVLRGCEEPCGSPRVRTLSVGRAPSLLSRLSETSSTDESMSDADSVPCSPLILPYSPLAAHGYLGRSPICSSFTGMYERERKNNNTGERKDSESGGDSGCPSERRSDGDPYDHVDGVHHRIQRHYSESDDDSQSDGKMVASPRVSSNIHFDNADDDSMTEEKWSFYHSSRSHVHRSSCVATEMDRLEALMQKKIGQSILGKVHLGMVRYHEAGRFL